MKISETDEMRPTYFSWCKKIVILIPYLSNAMLYNVDFEFNGTELQQNGLDHRAPKTSCYSDIVANFG